MQKEIFLENPVSVSDYITIINELLLRVRVKVVGEVAEMKMASSGHVYFSLKDEKSGDVINCAAWSSIYRMCGVRIENGMKVILSGTADVYRARGSLTFKVQTIELAGEGALKKAYDELKRKLTGEGLFDQDRKRNLPEYPEKIGVITSTKGAVIHDFVNNLGKFGFKVFVCDSRVEGQEAVEDLLKAFRAMSKKDIELLVIIRGGGSLQSLMAFDNEMVVREIVNFKVPVVAGIGHHEDVTLAALAADFAESTPTATANLISAGFIRATDRLSLYEEGLKNDFAKVISFKKEEINNGTEKVTSYFRLIIDKYKKRENEIERLVSNFSFLVAKKEEILMNLKRGVMSSFASTLKDAKAMIQSSESIVKSNDPHRQLKLGYAIMKKNGSIVKNIDDLKEGDVIDNTLYNGSFSSEIKKINKKK